MNARKILTALCLALATLTTYASVYAFNSVDAIELQTKYSLSYRDAIMMQGDAHAQSCSLAFVAVCCVAVAVVVAKSKRV